MLASHVNNIESCGSNRETPQMIFSSRTIVDNDGNAIHFPRLSNSFLPVATNNSFSHSTIPTYTSANTRSFSPPDVSQSMHSKRNSRILMHLVIYYLCCDITSFH